MAKKTADRKEMAGQPKMMPTKRRVRKNCSRKSTASARESLPVDLLLEIIVCSDVTTIVRWARTCRTLRLSILEPAFRRRLGLRSAADGGGGFNPALLLGISFLPTAQRP